MVPQSTTWLTTVPFLALSTSSIVPAGLLPLNVETDIGLSRLLRKWGGWAMLGEVLVRSIGFAVVRSWRVVSAERSMVEIWKCILVVMNEIF